ncbi:phosphotransferase [Geodermatophilus sp. SYSU D00684]
MAGPRRGQGARLPARAGQARSPGRRRRRGALVTAADAGPPVREALDVVRTVAPEFVPVACVRLKHGKSDVVEVRGRGARPSLVAKCAQADTIAVEHRVLGWLEAAPFPSVHTFGTAPARAAGRAWLVSEYAAGVPYDARSAVHRRVAGAWMGEFHTWSGSVVPPDLPSRDLAYHRAVVSEACATLADALDTGEGLTRPHRTTISRLEAVGRDVLARWSDVQELLDELPATLVHSGIAGKNVRMAMRGDGPAVLAFDWEQAGWGCPAADLSMVDLHSYTARVRRAGLDLAEPRLVGAVGEVLWCFAGISGERLNLIGSWPHRAVGKLEFYLDRIEAGVAVVDAGRRP